MNLPSNPSYGAARSAYIEIERLMDALSVDYEYMATLRTSVMYGVSDGAFELDEMLNKAGRCLSYDDALIQLCKSPVQVLYRSGWSEFPEGLTSEEYCIMLCHRGPAMRIIGDYEHHRPVSARFEFLSESLEWVRYAHSDNDVLINFARAILGTRRDVI